MLIQLVSNEFFFFESLYRLELFNDLLTCLTRQISTLEVLHGELIHARRAEPLAEVTTRAHHGSLALISRSF